MPPRYTTIAGDNELHDAILRNEYDRVKDIIRHKYMMTTNRSGTNDDHRIDMLSTALYYACSKNSNPDIVKLLLKRGADPNVVCQSDLLRTPLHVCASSSRKNLVAYKNAKRLLKYHVNVDIIDQAGMTPFHILCLGRIDKVALSFMRLLLQHGARMDVQSTKFPPSFFYLVLCSIGSSKQLLHDAIRLVLRYNPTVVNIPLLHDQVLNRNNMKGDTVIHCAVRKNKTEELKVILEEGNKNNVLLGIRNSNQETAMDLAHQFHNRPIIEYFQMILRQQTYYYLTKDWVHKKRSNK